MSQIDYSLLGFLLLPVCAATLAAQAPPPAKTPTAPADVLILNDEERLVGHLLRSNGSSVVFKSNVLGEVTVDWSKIKELHASGPYVLIGKNVKLGRHPDVANLPHGTLTASGQSVTIQSEQGAPTASVSVADAGHIMEEPVFFHTMVNTPNLFHAWNGSVTGGASIVEATQESRAFNGAIHLVRGIPTETWLASRDRTIVDFSLSDGFVAQPGTARVKTSILHASIERDEYFSTSRVYAFGQAIFDHNFSQGLDLQQNYGGGIGWTAIAKANTTLDLKGTAGFVEQQFQVPANNHNLIASTFAQTMTRKLPKGMVLLEQISGTPAWNELHAWLATGGVSITAPIYKWLAFTIGVQDNYLNDPPLGFKRNSIQATTGLTYTLH